MFELSDKQKEKYFHSTFLKEIGVEGQKKLLNAKVLIVGAGGLGSSSVLSLSSLGIGNITIIDDDKVSLSNLPRQLLFDECDIGRFKIDVIKEKLEKKNSDVSITAVKERLSESNASKILKGHDIVLDCTDNFETKFLIDDICRSLGIPFVIAGVSDFIGQVSTCLPNKTKDFKSLFSFLPVNIEKKYKDEDQRVFPLAVIIVANIAAMEVCKYILGIGELLLNKMLVVNTLTNSYKVYKFPEL